MLDHKVRIRLPSPKLTSLMVQVLLSCFTKLSNLLLASGLLLNLGIASPGNSPSAALQIFDLLRNDHTILSWQPPPGVLIIWTNINHVSLTTLAVYQQMTFLSCEHKEHYYSTINFYSHKMYHRQYPKLITTTFCTLNNDNS